jgi:hypothetical protein
MINYEKTKDGHYFSRIILQGANVLFDVELRGHVTIFEGDSSTCKSYFFKSLYHDYTGSVSAYTNAGIDGIHLINSSSTLLVETSDSFINILDGKSNRLFLIDNANSLLSKHKKVLHYISRDTDNQYLINARAGLGIPVSFNHFCELISDDNRILSKFEYSVPAWR